MRSYSMQYGGSGLAFLSRRLLRVLVLFLPTAILSGAALQTDGDAQITLWLGTGFQVLVCFFGFLSPWSRQQPMGPAVITLYLIALGWLWWGGGESEDWFMHLSRAVLLVIPMLVFGFVTLTESGAPALRRARILAQRLANRKDWPVSFVECKNLPEVKALREALYIDATPALALLQNQQPEVRVAALAALEFRKNWRAGQAEFVMRVAQTAAEPQVRAAAVMALGNLDDQDLIEQLANFLHDTALEVRQAAAEAILWDTENRWRWIRHTIRRTLADPLLQDDGPLQYNGNLLAPETITELTGWAAEKGILAIRASLTLAAHYNRAMSEKPDEGLLVSLRKQLEDPHTPAVLRIELARLLWNGGELDHSLLDGLINPANPAPLRLIAVEAMLSDSREYQAPVVAMLALRELASMPNREIALATAELVQRRLGIDLGLPQGQPLPACHSRQAAEITRRVMMWASQQDVRESVVDSQPLVEL